MLFASYIVSHFSRRFVKKTAGIWTLLRLGDLKQVHGVPENSCNPSENDSRCGFLLIELSDFRDFALVSQFSKRFLKKTAATMILSRVRSPHGVTWGGRKLVQPSWKPIFEATWTRFPNSRM